VLSAAQSGSKLALICAGQGFPVPSFRYLYNFLMGTLSLFLIAIFMEQEWFDLFFVVNIEPVGSTKPKFGVEVKREQPFSAGVILALLCPAQGFPVPSYR